MRRLSMRFSAAALGFLLAASMVSAQSGYPQSGTSQSGAPQSAAPVTPSPAGSPPNTSPFQGSVPSGGAITATPLPLSLNEALQRGLRYNLGGFDSQQTERAANGERIATLSNLLPNVSAGLKESVLQIDLAALGFNFSFPASTGIAFPKIIGPYNYFDLRGYLTQKVADVQSLRSYQSSRESQRAATFSVQDARDIVVYVVTAGYLQVIADLANVESAKSQVASAQAIAQQASDRLTAGLSARIDSTRSTVELEAQQQRLTAELAGYAKDKIALARLIGLPSGQDVTLTDALPYAPLESITLEQAVNLAAQNRSDLKAAEAQMRAAELTRKAAVAERYPTLDVSADYGDIGINPGNSHGTFTVVGQLNFPIWAGGRSRGDIEEADAALQQRRAAYEDLRARVEAQVRDAFLDLNAASDQLRVAQNRRALAQDELQQARDRFASGVADTVEVVQAQEVVSSAETDYIASLNAHNLAKASVARSTGQAEKIMLDLLRSK